SSGLTAADRLASLSIPISLETTRFTSIVSFVISAFILLLRPRTPPLFPYTTLFRSLRRVRPFLEPARAQPRPRRAGDRRRDDVRSEEHTSELQSREKIVCRLLLEKKKEDAQFLRVGVTRPVARELRLSRAAR